MKAPPFNQFVERLRRVLARLSRQQIATVRDVAAAFAAHSLCLDLTEQHGRQHPGCPHCHCAHVCRLPYLECMLDSKTVRKSADTVDIHRNTSFRWRHRFLIGARQLRRAQLQGIVEADETCILELQKGSRHLTRPARHRGGVARTRGITKQPDCIAVARDRAEARRLWLLIQAKPSIAANSTSSGDRAFSLEPILYSFRHSNARVFV